MPHSFYINQHVKVKSNNTKVRGTIKDLDQNNKLYIVETENGYFNVTQEKIEPDYSFRN